MQNVILKKEMTLTIKYKLKILYAIQLLVLLILIPFLIKAIPNIMSMEASTYRSAVFSTDILYSSNIFEAVFDFFVQPMILTGLLLGTMGSLLGYKYKRLFVLSTLNAILFSIMTLGRWYFLRIIIFLLLGFLLIKIINKNKKNININMIKRNKNLLLSLLPVGIISIFISSFRGNGSNSILYTFYEYVIRYFTGSFLALDRFLKDYYNDTTTFYFGRVTLAGLEEIIVFFIRRIDSSVENIKSSISSYTNDFINIGGGHTYNAFYTAIYNFLLDGGLLALVLYGLLFGIIVGFVYNYYIVNPNLFSISLLVFLVYVSLVATLRWEFFYPMSWIVVLNLILLITRVKFTNKKST